MIPPSRSNCKLSRTNGIQSSLRLQLIRNIIGPLSLHPYPPASLIILLSTVADTMPSARGVCRFTSLCSFYPY